MDRQSTSTHSAENPTQSNPPTNSNTERNNRFGRGWGAWLAIALGAMAIACTEPPPETEAPATPTAAEAPLVASLNGAGATFPAILYQRWFQEFNRRHPGVEVNFQPIGSGAGIQQLLAGTVDFAASDVAMTDAEIARVEGGVRLVPMTGGSVAIAYNLPEVGGDGLRLSREVLAEIFQGKIERWRDPKLVALNPDANLPDLPLILVRRSDGSGTTAVLTAHLSAIAPDWQAAVGAGLSVEWPAGIGVKSNAGVSAQIQQAVGAIGYVESAYAQQLGLSVAALENKAGAFVLPSVESTTAALAEVKFPENLRAFTADPTGAEAYPIATYTWLLVYQDYDDPAMAEALEAVLIWSLTEGQALAPELGYVPLPAETAEKALAAIADLSPATP